MGGINDETIDLDDAPTESVRVFIRTRPLLRKEVSSISKRNVDNEKVSVEVLNSNTDENVITFNNKRTETVTEFDAVFNEITSQQEIFEATTPYLESLLEGYDSSILAYGETRTGKTYSLCGRKWSSSMGTKQLFNASEQEVDEHSGIIPRSFPWLFNKIVENEAKDDSKYELFCSYFEVYNENIYDLLTPVCTIASKDKKEVHKTLKKFKRRLSKRNAWNRANPEKPEASLSLRESPEGTAYVDGLTCRRVTTQEELHTAFTEGCTNREVRNNLYNEHRSRSHAIFQVSVRKTVHVEASAGKKDEAQTDKHKAKETKSVASRLSRISFVDLAGSEVLRLDESTTSEAAPFSEMSSINRSINALTHCVQLLSAGGTHIPYRNSLLTRILKSSFEGDGRTSFLITLSPSIDSVEGTNASLRFATRVRSLVAQPVMKNTIYSNILATNSIKQHYEKKIQKLRLEVARLSNSIQTYKTKMKQDEKRNSKGYALKLEEENTWLKEMLDQAKLLLDIERKNFEDIRRKVSSMKQDKHTEENPFWIAPYGTSEAYVSVAQFLDKSQSNAASVFGVERSEGISNNDNDSVASGHADNLGEILSSIEKEEQRINLLLHAEIDAQRSCAEGQESSKLKNGSLESRSFDKAEYAQYRAHSRTVAHSILDGGDFQSENISRMFGRKHFLKVPDPIRSTAMSVAAPRSRQKARLTRKISIFNKNLHVEESQTTNGAVILPKVNGAKPAETNAGQQFSEVVVHPIEPKNPSKTVKPKRRKSLLNDCFDKNDCISVVVNPAVQMPIATPKVPKSSGREFRDSIVEEYKKRRELELEEMISMMNVS